VPLTGEQRVIRDEALAPLLAGLDLVEYGGERALGVLGDVDQAVLQLGLDDLDQRVALQADLQRGEGVGLAEHAEQVLALAVEAGGLVGEAQLGQERGELGLAAALAVLGLDEVEEEDAGAVLAGLGHGQRGRVGRVGGGAVGRGEQAREGEEAGAGDERAVTQEDRDDAHGLAPARQAAEPAQYRRAAGGVHGVVAAS